MTTIKKPLYVNPTGTKGPRDLPSSPPFEFHNVTARVFPLKANISRLTDFCDSYLNMDIPDEIVHFFPALPYVYLAVVNYGSMSPLSFSAQNVGWVAQDEVFFLIPVEKWIRKEGKMVFKEWACVSPFIFVNDSMSMTTGREVYGWAKVLGEIAQETPLWVKDPTAPTRLFGLKAPVFLKEYQGRREENRILLEIDRSPPTSFATFPPNLSNPALNLSDAMYAWLGVMGSAVDILASMPLRGYRQTRSARSVLDKALLAGGEALRMFRNPLQRQLVNKTADNRLGYGRMAEAFSNQITLKQFRDAGHPNHACYQALVSSRMGVDRLNRFGLLGDYNLLFGDPSGGFSIRLHQYEAYPIVDALGLEVQRVEDGADASIAIIKPVFPLWTDVDLYYDVGHVICSRHLGEQVDGHGSTWRAESDAHNHDDYESQTDEEGSAPEHRIPYNTVRGGSTQAIVGPFNFPDVTVQVYPLLADRDKLRNFLQAYLNTPLNPEGAATGLSFEPFGDYVYLMVDVLGEQEGHMWSESNNIGCWADKTVAFCVPVKFYRDGKLHSVALVTPYRFANDNRAVISDREINGRISVMSTIKSQRDVWLEESGPIKPRKLLELSTEVFPALEVGTQSTHRTLLQIDEDLAAPYNAKVQWRLIAERWREPLLRDLARKTRFKADKPELVDKVKSMALEFLALKAPINWINLKQYRDATNTSEACYQALVSVTRSIERVYDLREIEQRLLVRLYDFPDFPIVSTLGLKVMHVVSDEKGVQQILQPIRPFWMRFGAKENLGETLCWRTEEGRWNLTQALNHAPQQSSLRVGADVLSQLKNVGRVKQRLQEKTTQWLFKHLWEEIDEFQKLVAGLDQEKRTQLSKALETKSNANPNCTALSVALEAINLASQPGSAKQLRSLFRSMSAHDLLKIVDTITPLLIAQGLGIKSARLSLEEAKASVHALDDIQIVIESILSEEWEHWGNPRSANEKQENKPDYCIRSDTFQSDGFDFAGGGSNEGLKRFDNDLTWAYHYIPSKAESASA